MNSVLMQNCSNESSLQQAMLMHHISPEHHIYKYEQVHNDNTSIINNINNSMGSDDPCSYGSSIKEATDEVEIYRARDAHEDLIINANNDENFSLKSKNVNRKLNKLKMADLKHENDNNNDELGQEDQKNNDSILLFQKKHLKDKCQFKKTKENSTNSTKVFGSSRKLYQKKIKVMIMNNSTNHDLGSTDSSKKSPIQFCENNNNSNGHNMGLIESLAPNIVVRKPREKKLNSKKLLSLSSASTSSSSSSCSTASTSSQLNQTNEDLLMIHQNNLYHTNNNMNCSQDQMMRQNISLVNDLNSVSINHNSTNESSNLNTSLNNSSKTLEFIFQNIPVTVPFPW
jgi:hypothetical protein